QVLGLLVGFAGIAVLLGVWDADSIDVVGALLMMAATACYGFGTVWGRLHLSGSGLTAVALPAVQLTMAAVVVLPFAVTAPLPVDLSASSALALLALGVGGTGVAYVLFWRVLNHAGPAVASSVTYVLPVVSTTLGITVRGEALHWYEPAGGVGVLVGDALTQIAAVRAQRRLALMARKAAPAAATSPAPSKARRRPPEGS